MHAASGGFFDAISDPSDSDGEPEVHQAPPWMQPPQDLFPGRLILDEVMHRNESTLVLVREVRGYPNGLDVRLHWVRRRRDETEREWNAWIHQRLGFSGEPEREDLRVGFRLSDGTPVLPLDLRRAWRTGAEHSPPTLVVGRGGGGGGLDRYEGRLNAWLWTGEVELDERDLELVVEWLDVGMAETTVRLPAAMLGSIPPSRPMWG
jgi:hypothetical protein